MTYKELREFIDTLSERDLNKQVYVYEDEEDRTRAVIDWDITVHNDHVGSGYPILVLM